MMVNNCSELFDLIKNAFISGCNVSSIEANSSANVVVLSYAWGVNQPINDISLDHMRKLEQIFNNEINNGALDFSTKHAEVVETLSTKIMEIARASELKVES